MRDCPLRTPLSAKSITERLMGMNYQRSTNKRFALRSIVVCMLVLVALVACVAVSVYADGAAVTAEDIEIGADNVVVINGVRHYTKVYDGTTDVDGRLTLAEGFNTSIFEDHPNVKVAIDKAELTAADAGDASLVVSFKLVGDPEEVRRYQNQTPVAVRIPAKIVPAQLSWIEDLTAEASLAYSYQSTT